MFRGMNIKEASKEVGLNSWVVSRCLRSLSKNPIMKTFVVDRSIEKYIDNEKNFLYLKYQALKRTKSSYRDRLILKRKNLC